ncbi:MAG TPA: protein kinase [Fibrobacteria bacterium]|nr:protein kinase [Fibrobacteria bacterium]
MKALPRGFSTPILIGNGGEGQAILCWQDDPGRWVVLKMGEPAGRARLRREVDQLSRLAGGPVPAVIGQDLVGASPWIGLTWIDGLPLDELPAELSVSDRRALVLQAALAVARLHGARVMHGDLATANLIARPHGEVAIVDFGLSPSPDGAVPPVEGTWEILPPERLEGGSPDPRWDVFALGVLGLRVLGALPPGAESRLSWSQAVASGEVSKWARGRSWGLSLALEPDPANRPEDAAALVRLLEKDWGDPPLARSVLQLAVDHRMEHLLSRGVADARARRDWDSAWRIQRERIERSPEPEALFSELGEFQRLRTNPGSSRLPWVFAAIAALFAFGFVSWAVFHKIHRSADFASTSAEHPVGENDFADSSSSSDVLVFDPPPTGSVLHVDGVKHAAPRDGFLKLPPGTHHVELEDSMGESLLDTTWVVPRRTVVRRRARVARTDSPTISDSSKSTRKGPP